MEANYKIKGLDCPSCAREFELELAALPGIEEVRINYFSSSLFLKGDLDRDLLNKTAALHGLSLTPEDEIKGEAREYRAEKDLLSKTRIYLEVGASLLLLIIYLVCSYLGYNCPWLLPFAALLGGGRNFIRGIRNLMSLKFNTDVLMSLAVIGAFAIDQWQEGALVAFLFGVSEILESYTASRAKKSISKLIDAKPETAIIIGEGKEEKIPAAEVLPGQRLLLKAGEKVPVDALVIKGNSFIEQAAITGEHLPREVAPGDMLYSGSLNQQGVLEIEALQRAKDSTMSKIIRLVEEAQGRRGNFQGMVERFAKYYTPGVLFLAVFISLFFPLVTGGEWSAWIYRGLTLLVISCPCALVITAPIVLVSAISNGARRGILIKGGSYLERLAGIKIAAFDKTGTLSQGRPQLWAVKTWGISEENALNLAAALGKVSNHPLNLALINEVKNNKVKKAEDKEPEFKKNEVENNEIPNSGILNIEIQKNKAENNKTAMESKEDLIFEDLENIPGRGIQGRQGGDLWFLGNKKLFNNIPENIAGEWQAWEDKGNTVSALGNKEKIRALFAFRDNPRPEAAPALVRLRLLGIEKTVILSGDNPAAASAFGEKCGADEAIGGLLPEDKVKEIARLQKQGPVLMVGDGINDAPALAAADVSAAMGAAGSAAALEAADIALMNDDLNKLVYGLALSKRAVRVIKENIAFALGLKLLVIFAIFPGWLSLWLAILSDMGANILVTLNGMRLLAFKENRQINK